MTHELQIEPDLELGIEPDDIDEAMPTLAPEAAPVVAMAPVAPVALAEVLPADFPLPVLTKFIPNTVLRESAREATAYALSLDVTGPEGLTRVDRALTVLRAAQKAITDDFAEPARIANDLHKRLTGMRSEWCEPGEAALKTVGQRVWAEQRRLEAAAAEERRKAQTEADRRAREQLQREAAAAAEAKAPAPIVQELKRQAETATAPPVFTPIAAPVMHGTSAVTTWKSRPKGTPADADPNPKVAAMTPSQLDQVRHLLAGILAEKAPITAIEINYSTLNGRAKSDKQTFSIPGFEAFEEGGVRAKGRRA